MTCFFSDGILDGIEHLSQRKSKENQSLGLLIDNRVGRCQDPPGYKHV